MTQRHFIYVMLISHAGICALQISFDRHFIFTFQGVGRLYFSLDYYVDFWNLFRVA